MSLKEVDAIAQGRVWSGVKAKELGLVDELGDLEDAVSEAAKIAGLEHYDTLLIEKELSPKEMFLRNFFGNAAKLFAPADIHTQGPVEKVLAQLKAELNKLNQLNDPQGIYSFCLTCEIY